MGKELRLVNTGRLTIFHYYTGASCIIYAFLSLYSLWLLITNQDGSLLLVWGGALFSLGYYWFYYMVGGKLTEEDLNKLIDEDKNKE